MAPAGDVATTTMPMADVSIGFVTMWPAVEKLIQML
jgi:hypothetical protein